MASTPDPRESWHRRQAGALAILAAVGGFWRVVAALRAVPRLLRDAVYDWIAHHRYA